MDRTALSGRDEMAITVAAWGVRGERRGRCRDEDAGHRGRRIHRLAPDRAADTRRPRRARPRQLRHGAAGEPPRTRRRHRADRGRSAELRARAQRRTRVRGGLPPGRASVGAAVGPGPAHQQRDDTSWGRSTSCSPRATPRCDASYSPRPRPSTGRTPRCRSARIRSRSHSHPTPSRSSPARATAAASPRSTGSRP